MDPPTRFAFGSRTLTVTAEPLERLSLAVDGLVSSDDNWLSHRGGVSAALWKAAGRAFARQATESPRPKLSVGDVHVTTAGRLNAKLLLHAVTLDLDQGTALTPDQLPTLVRRLMLTAEAAGAASLGLPMIGAGAAGLEVGEVTAGLCRALETWLASPPRLPAITIAVPTADVDGVVGAMRDFAATAPPPVEQLVRLAPQQAALRRHGFDEAWARYERSTGRRAEAALVDVFEISVRAMAEATGSAGNPDRHVKGTEGPPPSPVASAASDVRALLDALVASREEARAPSLVGALSAAAHVRNRVVHGQPTAWPEDHDTLARATLQALMVLTTGLTAPPTALSRLAEPAADTLEPPWRVVVPPVTRPSPKTGSDWELLSQPIHALARQVPLPLAPASLAASLRVPTPGVPLVAPSQPDTEGATAHVRRLQAFLLEHLDPEAQAALDRQLLENAYRGDYHLRVLEYCVRTDPVKAVADLFPVHRLRALVRALTGRAPVADRGGHELAQDVLSHLGFPRPVAPLGLDRVAKEVRQALKVIDADDDADPAAVVNLVARRLEYLMKVLVRFLSQAVFQQSPERLLRLDKPLSTHGLGELLRVATQLQGRLQEAGDRARRVFDRDFTRDPVLPTGVGSLPKVRNSFSHFRERAESSSLAPDATPSQTARGQARQFLLDTAALLDYLRDDRRRVFPQVVRVERVTIDNWNRRTVHVVDDDGAKDVLFTDVALEPGRTFFMHAVANPLRVDPLLVPAGNLIWAD